VARDRKSSQRRRANAQPARSRPKPTPGKPADAAKPPVGPQPADAAKPPVGPQPVEGVDATADDAVLGDATVDEVFADDESVMAALEPADLPVGAVPTDPPTLPPLADDELGGVLPTGGYATTRDKLAANRLDESDEILPAARRAAGRPPAKVGGNKVTSFLRASWAELQRVQWPDRRQVGQATAVVLGFVVVAGGFLGLADLLGSDLVNAIL
jgi:preprotein translocase SecE subunit